MSPAQPYRSSSPDRRPADYRIADQSAGVINNVGRDQHNAYVTHVLQQRESFLRDVAAAKSKARVLSWLGGLLTLAGFATWMFVIFSFARRIPTFSIDTEPAELFGPEVIGGIRLGEIAAGTMLLGMVLLIVGIVLHITSAARRRRVDRELPLPFGSYGPVFR